MATEVWGQSDDNVYLWGDITDQLCCYETDLRIELSDGTVLKTHYGKKINGLDEGVWEIEVEKEGSLFQKLELCFDPEADRYSDVAHFKDGLTGFKVLDPSD